MTSGRTSDSTNVDDIRIIGFDRNESAFAGPGKCILSEGNRTVLAGAGDTSPLDFRRSFCCAAYKWFRLAPLLRRFHWKWI